MRGSSGERQPREGKVCGQWERLAVASGFGRDGNEGSVLMTGGLWLSLVLAQREGRLQQVKRGRTALPVRWWGKDEMVVGAKIPKALVRVRELWFSIFQKSPAAAALKVDLGFCFFKGEGAAAERIDFLGFPLFP